MQGDLEVVGRCLGLDGVLAWAVPTFLILISIWKLVSRDWNIGDAVALIVLSIIIMVYYTHDISKIVTQLAQISLGIGTGVIVGYLIKNDED